MRTLKLCLVMIGLLSLPGCAGCRNQLKHMQSDVFGLKRRIVLYGPDGVKIREWETTAKVEDQGGSCWFLTSEGKAVTISGNFTIEEL